jgi:hypothetical protein
MMIVSVTRLMLDGTKLDMSVRGMAMIDLR